MPRDLLLRARAEIRALTGHWAQGFMAGGQPLVQHDSRQPDGGCYTCQLLAELDYALHDGGVAADPGTGVAEVLNLGARRRVAVEPGVPLGRRP